MKKRLMVTVLGAMMLIFLLPATAFATATDSGPLPTVTGVTVTPNTASVEKGSTLQFSATVTGDNNPAQTVIWAVEDSTSDTFIDVDGVLNVVLIEEATTLTVKATSTVDESKCGTATVTLTPPSITFSPSSGSFTAEQSVTMSFAVLDAMIHYTTDGSDPTELSAVYTDEISVKETTIIKAVAIITDYYISEVFTANYFIGDESTDSSTGDITAGGDSSTGDSGPAYTLPPVTIYNDPVVPNATVWLVGSGLDSGDVLIIEKNPAGSEYQELLSLADSSDVFATYDISLRSGKHKAESAMRLTFNLDVDGVLQDFTLVHQKGDGTYEYFYDAANANGDLTFGPLYELSPFMLVKGHLEPNPGTGDKSIPELWLCAAIPLVAGIAALIVIRRKKRQNG